MSGLALWSSSAVTIASFSYSIANMSAVRFHCTTRGVGDVTIRAMPRMDEHIPQNDVLACIQMCEGEGRDSLKNTVSEGGAEGGNGIWKI